MPSRSHEKLHALVGGLPLVLSLGEDHVPDIARRRRQSNTARLSPGGLVDFVLVSDRQITGYSVCDKDRVVHFSARMAVLTVYLFPQLNAPKLKLWKLLLYFPPQTVFFAFAIAFLTARKHPQLIAFPSH